jgi:hypothetical protein
MLRSTLIVLLVLSTGLFAQSVTFTGDAAADFAGAFIIADPGGQDVGVPMQLTGATSGWDIANVGLAYDEVNDQLLVGIDFFGIAGDADGDGDPNSTSAPLAGIGGSDNANWAGSESFTFALDLDDDGNLDVITGITPGGDISSLSTNLFSGSIFAPFISFGAPLPAHNPILFATPSAATPDIEFSIPNFSGLLNLFATPGLANIGIHAFAGSQEDAGIGEDFLPATFVQPVSVDNFPCLPIANQYQLESFVDDGQNITVTTSFGLISGYGCCVLISSSLQPVPVVVTSVPNTPTVLVGTFGDPSSLEIIDFGVPAAAPGDVSCKINTYTLPSGSVPSGSICYAQVYAYPAAPSTLDHFTSNVINVVFP